MCNKKLTQNCVMKVMATLNMDDSEDWEVVVSKAIENGTWNPPPLPDPTKPMSEELRELLNEVDPFSMSEAEFDILLSKKEEEFRLRKKD